MPGRDAAGRVRGRRADDGGRARLRADFNALTFYAKSSVVSTLNEVGFGNDNTGTSVYSAGAREHRV
ncbi:MAG: hypothetical protein IPK20_00555 [Betaproteobacteria bacterium]|nr:hypothetical protein [Betaproteobacteria bacterium]